MDHLHHGAGYRRRYPVLEQWKNSAPGPGHHESRNTKPGLSLALEAIK